MSRTWWVDRLFGARPRRTPVRPVPLRLSQLEDRITPTLKLTYAVGGTLSLTETAAAADTVTVSELAGDILRIDLNGANFDATSTLVGVTYDLVAPALSTKAEVDISVANNVALLSLALGDAADALTVGFTNAALGVTDVTVTDGVGTDTVTLAGVVAGGAISVAAETINLTGNVQTDGKAIGLTGNVVVQATVAVDSETGADTDAGTITFSGGTISASAGGFDLTIDATSLAATKSGGAVGLVAIGNAGGAFLNDVSVDARGGAGGTNGLVTTSAGVQVTGAGADAGSITLGSSVRLGASVTLNATDALIDGGAVQLTNATVSATAAGVDLVVNTSHTGGVATKNGGAVTFGVFNADGGNAIDDVTVTADTGGAGGARGALAFNGNFAIGGALNVTAGGVTQPGGTVAVGGAATFVLGAGDLLLASTSNNFNSVAATNAGNVNLGDANAIVLGASSITGALAVTAAGAITQTAAVAVTGTATLAAGAANNITLTSANNFSTVVVTSGNNVALTDGGAIDLGASTVSGTLDVVATGDITDSGDLSVAGAASFNPGGSSVTLNSAGNDFASVGVTNAVNATLVDVNAVVLNATSVTNLNVTAGGAITDAGNLAVFGTATLKATGFDITLNSAGNNFNLVTITAGNNVTLVDANAVEFAGATVSGALDVTAAGAVTDSGDVVVTGATTINAGGGSVALDSSGNDFNATGVTNAANVTLVDINDITLTATTATGTITVTAGGSVLQSGTVSAANGVFVANAGQVNLTLANAIATIAGTAADQFKFTTTAGLAVAAAGVSGANGVTLTNTSTTAGQDLDVTGDVLSTAGAVVLASGNNLDVTSAGNTVTALTTITITIAVGNADANGRQADVTGALLTAPGGTLITGGTGKDQFFLTGSTTSVISVNGGLPTLTPPGDKLTIDAQNLGGSDDGSVVLLAGLLAINYVEIETLKINNPGSPFVKTVNGTAGADTLILRRNAGVLEYKLNADAFVAVNGSSFKFNGKDGADTMVVDFSGGAIGLADGVEFDGDIGGPDVLHVVGDGLASFGSYQPDATTPGKGFLLIDGVQSVKFVNLTPIDVTAFASFTVVLPNKADVLTVTQGKLNTDVTKDAIVVDGTSGGVAIEKAAFRDIGTLTVDTTTNEDGAFPDAVTVSALDALPFVSGLKVVTAPTVAVGPDLVTIAGAVQLTGDLEIQTNTAKIGGGSVKTGGFQKYNAAPTTLTANAALDAGGNVTFTGAVGGLFDLDVAAAGVTTFGGPVSVANLTTDAPGTTTVSGGTVTTTGDQTFNDGVTVAALDATFAGANVTFAKTLGGAKNVAVNSPGTTTFNGLVTVAKLTTDAGGTTKVNGGGVTTTGDQTYGDPVEVAVLDPTFAGANVTFTGALTGAKNVAVNASGTTTFGGAVTVASLATDAGGTTQVNGGGVTTTGDQTYGDPVTVGANTLFDAGGNVTFNSTLGGATKDVAVNSPGATTFGGLVTVAKLTTDAGGTTKVNGGGVTTTGDQTYGDPVSVGVTNAGFNGANVTFGSTLDGPFGATVNTTGGGATTFTGPVGGTPLAFLTTNADGATAVNGATVTTTGAQTFNDGVTVGADTTFTSTGGGAVAFNSALTGAFNVAVNTTGTTTFANAVNVASLTTDGGGTTQVNGGTVTTSGGQSFNDAVTVGADATFTSTGGAAVLFAATLDGGKAVAVNTAGATTFAGKVGNAAPLASLTTDGVGTTAVNGSLVQTTGNQTFNDPVAIGDHTTFAATAAGAVTFNATLTGTKNVAVNTTGTTTFAAAVNVASLITNAGGTTLVNGGAVTTSGGQTYNDAVTVGANAVFGSAGGAGIAFNSTLSGAKDVVVNTAGTTTFGGAVNVASLTTNAGGTTQVNGGAVTTTAQQDYGDAVALGADAVLTATGGAGVTFQSTTDGPGGLTVTAGVVFFQGAVGGTVPLASLTVNPGVTGVSFAGGLVRTAGAQTFNGAVNASGNTTFTSTGGGAITFNGALAAGGSSLVVNTAGVTQFNGAVTAFSLVTDAAGTTAVNTGTVTTTGGQTFNDPVTLLVTVAFTAGDNITFASTLDGPGGATVAAAPGSVTFGGAVGGTTPLAFLTVAPNTLARFLGVVKTAAALTFSGPVVVVGDTTFVAGTVTFASTLDGPGGATVNSAGTTTFGAAVGGVTPLAFLVTDAAGNTAVNGATVRTAGGQTFNDGVAVGDHTTFTSTGGGAITFNSTLSGAKNVAVNTAGTTAFGNAVNVASLTTDAGGTTQVNGVTVTTTGPQVYNDAVVLAADAAFVAGGNITFAATLDGPGAAAVSSPGDTTFGGAVGGTTPLAALTTDAAGATVVAGGLVRTAGGQTFNDPVFLAADATFASTAGGAVTFNATLTGAKNVAVNTAGGTTFGGAVNVGSLTTDAGGTTAITGGTVTTAGDQLFNDPVTLGASATFTAGGGVTFANTLNGPAGAAVSAGPAGATFGGAVGGVVPLAFLTVSSAQVNGGLVRTTGSQTFGPVVLGADTLFNSTAGGNLTFQGTLTGAGKAATFDTAGASVFGGAVSLGSVRVESRGVTFVSGGSVATTGTQTYLNGVETASDTTFTAGGAVTFQSALTNDCKAVVVNSPAAVTFNAAVTVGSLTTDAPGSTVFAGGAPVSVTTCTFQSYGDPVFVASPGTTLFASKFVGGSGNVTFAQTLQGTGLGSRDVTVNTAGTTTFGGAVFGLRTLTTDAAGTTAVNGGAVTTTADQLFGDPVAVGANTTFAAGGNARFSQTLGGAGFAVVVNAAGTSLFGGNVAVGSLTTDAAGGTTFADAAELVTGTGGLAFNDPVTVARGVQFTSGGGVTFATTLTGVGQPVVVDAAGPLTLGGPVRVGSLRTTPGGQTVVRGGSVVTDSTQDYGDEVVLGTDTRFEAGGDLRFLQGVVAETGVQTLTADAGANIATGGPVRAPSVTVSTRPGAVFGDIAFGAPVEAGTLTVSGSGTVRFNGPVSVTQAAVTGQSVVVNADFTSLTDIRFELAGGTLTQHAGRVVSPTLGLFGKGDYFLERPANDLDLLRANLGSTIRLTDADDLTIDPTAGLVTIDGDVFLTVGGNFSIVDPRTGADKYSTPLVNLGKGRLVVNLTGGAGVEVRLDAEIVASELRLGDAGGGNVGPDQFRVRPSATTPILVFGNGPGVPLPANAIGDRLFPDLKGLTVSNFTFNGTDGTYDFVGRARLSFFGIETLQRFALEGFVVQTTEPRDATDTGGAIQYAVRVLRSQDGVPLGGGLDGSGLPENPFVVSPARVNPTSSGSSPRLGFGDVNGDGSVDVVIANGPGSVPLVTILDGRALNVVGGQLARLDSLPPGAVLSQFYAYDQTFLGGVNVAVGDLTGDGRAEVVTGAELGGGPHIRSFSLDPAPAGTFTPFVPRELSGPFGSFFAFEPSFTGGVRVAIGDVTGDGRPDLLYGAGLGGGPRVTVRDGATGATTADFFAYDPGFRGGIFVDASDFDGDGRADVLTGPGVGGGAHVRVFSGSVVQAAGIPPQLANFFAFDAGGSEDNPLFGLTGAGSGVGGIAFGASTPTGQRTILVSSARGPQTLVMQFVLSAGRPAVQGNLLDLDLFNVPGGTPGNPNPVIVPAPDLLRYGATVAGFLDESV